MTIHHGRLDARGKRFAIVASRFNDFIVESLERAAKETLVRLGADDGAIEVFRVPGAFEIPAVAARVAASTRFDAVICLGCVIRGATPHFDYVAGECARGVAEVARSSPVPIVFGVLTTETIEQAIERAGTKAGNKGADAAFAAAELVNLWADLERNLRDDG